MGTERGRNGDGCPRDTKGTERYGNPIKGFRPSPVPRPLSSSSAPAFRRAIQMQRSWWPEVHWRHRRKPGIVELVRRWVKGAPIGKSQPKMIALAKIAFHQIVFDTMQVEQRGKRRRHGKAHHLALAAVQNALTKACRKSYQLLICHVPALPRRRSAACSKSQIHYLVMYQRSLVVWTRFLFFRDFR